MLHQFCQVSPYSRQDETTTSTFPVFPKSATKKQAQFPQNGIFLLKRYKAADSTNMTPSHSPDSPMTIFIRTQKNPIYMRLHICFYRPSIRVRAQRIKIITFVPPFSLISVFVCFEQKKAVSFTLTTISTIAQTRLYCQLANNIFRETAKTKHKMIRSLFLMTNSLKDLITYYKD